MPECPPETDAAFARSARSASDTLRTSGSAVAEEVVGLFDELRGPLLRYLLGMPLALPDAEDVIQETFLALFQHLRRGNPHRNVRGWLFGTAHNLALKKHLRSRRDISNAGLFESAGDLVADPNPNPEDQFAFNQTQQRILAVVRALPEQNRWCLYLRAEGLRYREIANILGISLGSVSLYLQRSLAQIARAAKR